MAKVLTRKEITFDGSLELDLAIKNVTEASFLFIARSL